MNGPSWKQQPRWQRRPQRRRGRNQLLGVLLMAVCDSFSTPSAVRHMCGVYAAPASPDFYREEQPDGSLTIPLRMMGDPRYHYLVDGEGYPVIKDDENESWFVYATKDVRTGELVSSGVRVPSTTEPMQQHVHPRKLGLQPHVAPDAQAVRKRHGEARRRRNEQGSSLDEDSNFDFPIRRRLWESSIRQLVNGGSRDNPNKLTTLTVLIRFSDHKDRALASPRDVSIMLNERGGHPDLAPTGSVHDVWRQNSYGKFHAHFKVTSWIDVPWTEREAANENWGWLDPVTRKVFEYAMDQIDPLWNLAAFDANDDGLLDSVAFLHSGLAAEIGSKDCKSNNSPEQRIWSHKDVGRGWTSAIGGVKLGGYFVASAVWPTNLDACEFSIGRIGVIAHEGGHHVGLPDLYGGETDTGNGNYDFMSNMWGWDVTLMRPPYLSPWSKLRKEWVRKVHLNARGTYTIQPAAFVDEVYIVSQGFPDGEYLALEYRKPLQFDQEMPGGGGLAIWHIDTRASHKTAGHPGQTNFPANGQHYVNALLQADGKYDLEKGQNHGDDTDLFRFSDHRTACKIGPNGIAMPKKQGDDAESVTWLPLPNTRAYQGGNVLDTGITITILSEPGETITFRLDGENLDEEGSGPVLTSSMDPVDRTSVPTLAPTTSAPTVGPRAQSMSPSTETPTTSPSFEPSSAELPATFPTLIAPTAAPSKVTLSPIVLADPDPLVASLSAQPTLAFTSTPDNLGFPTQEPSTDDLDLFRHHSGASDNNATADPRATSSSAQIGCALHATVVTSVLSTIWFLLIYM